MSELRRPTPAVSPAAPSTDGGARGGPEQGTSEANSAVLARMAATESEEQIERAIRDAYSVCKKVKTQGDRVKVQGMYGSMRIEMWVNTKTYVIETAYPKAMP